MTLGKDAPAQATKAAPTAVEPQGKRDGRGGALVGLALRYPMVWVLIAFAIVASILYRGFLAPANINNMIAQVAPVGIVALGMTYVIIAGGFDLSVAAVFAGASVAYSSLSNALPLWLAFILTVLIGLACGVINGLVITVVKVNPFIATLSTASLFAGVTYLYSGGLPVIADSPGFGTLGSGKLGSIWITVYLLVILTVVAGILLSRTTYGRSVYAVGGNAEAARLAGARVDLVRVSTYMITGACAAVGGMITASQIGLGQPTIGATITLDSIAIVIIGGTSLLGGEGSIWRTVIGLAIWAMISNLFSSLAVSTGARLLMVGLIVLFAVAIDSFSRRTRR